jgi:hypothetical protein
MSKKMQALGPKKLRPSDMLMKNKISKDLELLQHPQQKQKSRQPAERLQMNDTGHPFFQTATDVVK